LQEKTINHIKAQSKAGPVLKVLFFGFPKPKSYGFTSQNSKGEG